MDTVHPKSRCQQTVIFLEESREDSLLDFFKIEILSVESITSHMQGYCCISELHTKHFKTGSC